MSKMDELFEAVESLSKRHKFQPKDEKESVWTCKVCGDIIETHDHWLSFGDTTTLRDLLPAARAEWERIWAQSLVKPWGKEQPQRADAKALHDHTTPWEPVIDDLREAARKRMGEREKAARLLEAARELLAQLADNLPHLAPERDALASAVEEFEK